MHAPADGLSGCAEGNYQRRESLKSPEHQPEGECILSTLRRRYVRLKHPALYLESQYWQNTGHNIQDQTADYPGQDNTNSG